ncbi:MAG: disulfide bond formation protein B [Gammaproteobacteria bacterium]|jgi:disulfide bond formation protein DsbB
MSILFPRRLINTAGFAACAGLLGFAYFLQFHEGLDPCPLCIFQRLVFITVGILFLLAALHNPARVGSRIYAVLIAVAGLTGAGIAAWHLRLQHLPPGRVPECGPGLDYMLEVFPLSETLRLAFTGSGECADIVWTFLGLSIPAWALLWFLALAVAGLLRNWLPEN